MSRRGVLARAGAVAAGGALTGLVGEGLSTSLAFAAPAYTGDVLVVLSLRGGFDGLSAVVPAGDPDYYRNRPTIGVPKASLIGPAGFFGLHPSMAPLLPYWQGGQLGAVQAVGQHSPTRSHFSAMEEMERAAPGTTARTGWIDRMVGVRGVGGAFQAVSLGGSLAPQSLAGPTPELAMRTLKGFKLDAAWDKSDPTRMARALRGLYADAPPVMAAAARSTLDAVATTTALAATNYVPANGAVYPSTGIGKALADVARLIKARVGLQVATVDFGDWDMHDNLGTPGAGQWMYDHLRDLAAAMAAFAKDLGPTGLAGTTLLTLSEFGRRVRENGSRGVDHGHGNVVLLLGGGVVGGRVHGRWPGLRDVDLDSGDLRGTTDYRSVVGEILQKRCRVGSLSGIFPGVTPTPLGLVRAKA